MVSFASQKFDRSACQGGQNGQAAVAGRVVGTNPTTSSPRAAQAQGRTAAGSGPCLLDRHPLCVEVGLPLGVSAPGDGLRQRHDVLAPPARLACLGHLVENLGAVARCPGQSRRHRLDGGRPRQLLGASRFWGAKTGPNPTDRGKAGSKRHLITDQNGTPLAIAHTGANVHDSQMAMPLVQLIPPIKQPRGRPRRRPDTLLADAAYHAKDKIFLPLRALGIIPVIAERNREHGSGLGQYRYVVEACFDWLFNWRRLRVRYEKRPDIHDGFLNLACAMICWNKLQAA